MWELFLLRSCICQINRERIVQPSLKRTIRQSDTAGNIFCILVVLVSSKEGPCIRQRLQMFSAARLPSDLQHGPPIIINGDGFQAFNFVNWQFTHSRCNLLLQLDDSCPIHYAHAQL